MLRAGELGNQAEGVCICFCLRKSSAVPFCKEGKQVLTLVSREVRKASFIKLAGAF